MSVVVAGQRQPPESALHQALRSGSKAADAKARDWAAVGVVVAAVIVSVAACVHFYLEQQLLAYHDSYSHLEISRRILTGRTSGIAQLGAIWLPVPHILQAVFAWNTTLYASGLAGAFVSMTTFVACALLIYRIVRVFSPTRAWPAIAAAATFMTNANMLYHQSTAMDELPFFAFTLLAVDGLVRWADTERASLLLRAAVASMLAMLCRYDGWFLAGMFAVGVLIMARRMGYSWRDTRGLTGMFVAYGVLIGSSGWMLYNWAIAGSPINFLIGANSSADQMAKRHTDVAVGSWAKALQAYAGALIADHGLVLLGAGVLGLVVILALERLSARSIPILALTTIAPFYLVTIETGQAPIGVPPVNAYLLNLRFGLCVALPAALLVGYVLSRLPGRIVFLASVLAVSGSFAMSAITFQQHKIVTVHEAQGALADQAVQAHIGDFLVLHTGGPILLNLVGNERAAFPVLDRVIYEGTKSGRTNIWSTALRDPRSVGAEVVLMRNAGRRGPDEVHGALYGHPALAGFRIVFDNGEYTVYQLSD